MTPKTDPASLATARESIAQAILLSPFEGPMDPKVWDDQEISERSHMIQELFGDDLNALAAAGDIESLRSFFKAPWMDAAQRHRDRGQWAQSLFSVASLDILPALLDEIAAPNTINNDYNPGSPTTSPVWRECVGVALGRAQGDPLILAAVERYLTTLARSTSDIVRPLPKILSVAHSSIAPNDLTWALSLASEALRDRDDNDEICMPGFCSGVQSIFALVFPPRPIAFLAPLPSDPLAVERARRFLEWAAEIQIGDKYEPISERLLSLSGCFGRAPELAPALARLFARHDALEGCALSSSSEGLKVGIPPAGDKAPNSWEHPRLPWAAERLSPVDQALAWGAEEGALALTQAGFAWSSEPFIESCKAAMTGPQANGPWGHAFIKPLVAAERLAMRLSAAPAPKSGSGPARI